jgi:hypothetical protein
MFPIRIGRANIVHANKPFHAVSGANHIVRQSNPRTADVTNAMGHWYLTQAACCFASAKRLSDREAVGFLEELGWIFLEGAETSDLTAATRAADLRSALEYRGPENIGPRACINCGEYVPPGNHLVSDCCSRGCAIAYAQRVGERCRSGAKSLNRRPV